MVMKLESLRIAATMDVDQYVRAASQKNAADAQMVASVKAVGQALAATDATVAKAVPGVTSISRMWITGYGEAAKFEKAIRGVGNALDKGMDPARAAAALDGIYRKFGQVADATALAQGNFVKLVPIVAALNAEYDQTARKAATAADAQAALASRTAAAQASAARAGSFQAALNANLGVNATPATANGAGSEGLEAHYAKLAQDAQRYISALDPLSAAEARHNANLAEGARLMAAGEITARQFSTATANSAKAFKSVQDAVSGAAEEEKELLSTRDRLLRSYDILGTAERVHQKNVADATRLVAAGRIEQHEYDIIVGQSARVLADTQKSFSGAYTAQAKFATGTGLARHELINFSRQAQDVFVSLASGQAVMTVFIQQGAQIYDIFASSRGTVGGFLAQMGPILLRALPVIGAATTAVTALYAAFSVGADRQSLSNSLLGGGRASGLSSGDLEAAAKASAAAADITTSSARQIASEYVRLGSIAQANLPKLTQLTKDYAAATGQTLGDAAKELAGALGDPVKGAESLGEKIGTLDSTTVRMIRTANDFNDKLRAQRLLMDELGRATANAADQSLSKWERLTKTIGGGLDRVKEGVAAPFVSATDNEKIISQREKVAQLEAQVASRQSYGGNAVRSAQLALDAERQNLAVLEAQAAKKTEIAQTEAKRVQSNKQISDSEALSLTLTNGSLAQRLKLYNEELGNQNRLQKGVDELTSRRNAIGVPDASNRATFAELTVQIKEQTEALEAQKKKVADIQSLEAGRTVEQERSRRATELSIKASNDKTVADAKETAAIRVQNEAYGEAVGPQVMAQRIKDAQRETAAKGIVRLNEESKAIKDQIEATNAGAEATRRSGKAYGEVAEIRAKAKQTADQTGGDAEVIAQQELNKAIAESRKRVAELVDQRKNEASAARDANAEAISGNKSASQRGQLEERLRVERERLVELESKMGKGSAEAVRLAKEEAAAVGEVQRARNESGGADYYQQQAQELESLRKQRELVFSTRDVRIEELEVLRAQQAVRELGLDTETGIGRQIVDRARELGKEKQLTEDILRIRNQIRQAQDFAADSMKSFLSDLLTGTEGLNGALKNLGKGFLNSSLDALINGKGPLAGITGLASSTKDGQGGLLGMLTTGIQGLGKDVEEGTKKGSAVGTVAGINSVADSGGGAKLFSGFGINGKDLAGGLSAIAGLAGAYGSGMAAGSMGQALGGGALSGGMAGLALAGTGIGTSLGGAAVLGPIGLVAGAALAYFGQQSKKKQEKEARRQEAEAAYKEAQPQIAKLGSQLRGDAQGTIAQNFAELEQNAKALGEKAFYAGRASEGDKLWADFLGYKDRIIKEFRASFDGIADAMLNSLGPDSPFAQSRDSVKSVGDSLKVFVDNAKTAYGEAAPEVNKARAASRAYVLTILDGQKELSTVATRMQQIQGAAAGMQQVLVDLGASATDAANAIDQGVRGALARLKASFEEDTARRTNDALGYGYVNDVADLLKEVSTMRADAASLGSNQGSVTGYLAAKAQEIVNSSNLTGQAFADLLARFPELIGVVHEAGVAINATTRAIEAAARRLQYADRLFNALNDTSTLEGQLAANDRQAQKDREAEIKAGGDAINELEAALAAERLKIISDFAKAAADEQKRALEEAQNFFDTFSKNLKQFVDGLKTGSDSPLSPQARLDAARSQYNAQLALAQGGNRDAINSLTTYASAFLEASKAFNASSNAYQADFAQITNQLTALPTQVSAEQFIVNAINNSSQALIASIDTNGDGFISLQEATNAGLGTIFRELDVNGDGQISALELIRGATATTSQTVDYSNVLLNQMKGIQDYGNVLQSATNSIASTQASLLDQIRSLNDSSRATLDALLGQFTLNASLSINGANLNNNMVTALNKIVYNTAGIWSGVVKGPVPAAYATGGWIEGGVPNRDSVTLASGALGMPGEFVISKAVAQANASWLPTFNRSGRIPLPTASNNNGGSELSALRAAFEALRADVQQITRAVVASAQHVREGVDQSTQALTDQARDSSFKRRSAA